MVFFFVKKVNGALFIHELKEIFIKYCSHRNNRQIFYLKFGEHLILLKEREKNAFIRYFR